VLDTFALPRQLRCLLDGFFRGRHRLRKEPVMLLELRVGVQRLRAVWDVLDSASVSEVARRFGCRGRVIGRRGRMGVRIRLARS